MKVNRLIVKGHDLMYQKEKREANNHLSLVLPVSPLSSKDSSTSKVTQWHKQTKCFVLKSGISFQPRARSRAEILFDQIQQSSPKLNCE